MSNSKIVLSQQYLVNLYNTPSSVLSTNDLVKKINEETGNSFDRNTISKLYSEKLNMPLKNRPRKAGVEEIEIVFDLADQVSETEKEYSDLVNETILQDTPKTTENHIWQ